MSVTEDWAKTRLERLRAEHLDRSLLPYSAGHGTVTARGKELINLSGNDYLDLSADPRVIAAAHAATAAEGASSSASRLVTGTRSVHQDFETALADFTGAQSALIYGSGYMANLGVFSALITRHDVVVADRFVHASMLDAILLTRARLFRFEHNNIGDLSAVLKRVRRTFPAHSRVFVVTESVFSMDGDIAPLSAIDEITRGFDAELIVDEAHAFGVMGEGGRGLCYGGQLSQPPLAVIANCGKALGSYGGFALVSSHLRALLINTSRPFMYSTSLPAGCVAASLAALQIIREEPERGRAVLARAQKFQASLRAAGFNIPGSQSQIIPLIVGHNVAALKFSHRLSTLGVLGIAIRPPTVPDGSARIRFSVSYAHDEAVLAKAAQRACEAATAEGIL